MTINSIDFLLFFSVVFLVYFAPITRSSCFRQNLWLLIVSYFFYGLVTWKTIPLLLGLTIVYFFLGLSLKKTMDKGKTKLAFVITTIGICIGIGVLIYFKYLNFFAESFVTFLNSLGIKASWSTLIIILPVGVSFFTFKLISYIIEIHREHITPTHSFVEFAVYIAFFPTILSGPIDRPGKFFSQLREVHSFDFNKAVDGCQQIIWGLFTKMVIADQLGGFICGAWDELSYQSSINILFVFLLTPIYVYADFDGYSNMVIGVGKVLGFDIAKNFNHPFIARNTADYWRRWHISLTGWITDYVFMPLNIAFREIGKIGTFFAVLINLVLIGLWHGANWTYAIFGLYHAVLFIPLILNGKFSKTPKLKTSIYGLPCFNDVIKMSLTYLLIAIGFVIFFSPNIQAITHFFSSFANGGWSIMSSVHDVTVRPLLFSILFVLSDWYSRKKDFALQLNSHLYSEKTALIIGVDILFLLIIALYGNSLSTPFLYFQF